MGRRMWLRGGWRRRFPGTSRYCYSATHECRRRSLVGRHGRRRQRGSADRAVLFQLNQIIHHTIGRLGRFGRPFARDHFVGATAAAGKEGGIAIELLGKAGQVLVLLVKLLLLLLGG